MAAPVRLVHRPLPLLLVSALALVALPTLAQAPYTDHYGTWHFTLPAVGEAVPLHGAESVLLRPSEGGWFQAFVPVVPMDLARALPYQAYRPPAMQLECYEDEQTGNLWVRGEQLPVAGACTQRLELVDGERRFVVRFHGYVYPVSGIGFYCLQAAPASC